MANLYFLTESGTLRPGTYCRERGLFGMSLNRPSRAVSEAVRAAPQRFVFNYLLTITPYIFLRSREVSGPTVTPDVTDG